MKRFSGNGVGGVVGPVQGTTGLWILLPIAGAIVWFCKVQGAINRYWGVKGAPAP
jgi:hypothetical protein